jgi:hypothetical protein
MNMRSTHSPQAALLLAPAMSLIEFVDMMTLTSVTEALAEHQNELVVLFNLASGL